MENLKKLDEVAYLLGANKEDYDRAINLYKSNSKEALKKYLELEEDDEIKNERDFWYYYLADFTNSFFHNFGTKGYTKRIQNFLNNNNIKYSKIDFDDFLEKEEYYVETLFDILLSEVKFNLENKDLDIFGINIGKNSSIYYILPKENLKKIKELSPGNFIVFDFEKLEDLYGEIYRLKKEINDPNIKISSGEYVEKSKKEPVYRTLFNPSIKSNAILKNINENEYMELIL